MNRKVPGVRISPSPLNKGVAGVQEERSFLNSKQTELRGNLTDEQGLQKNGMYPDAALQDSAGILAEEW